MMETDLPENCMNCRHGKGLVLLRDSVQVICCMEDTPRFMSEEACCEKFEAASRERAVFYADGKEIKDQKGEGR